MSNGAGFGFKSCCICGKENTILYALNGKAYCGDHIIAAVEKKDTPKLSGLTNRAPISQCAYAHMAIWLGMSQEEVDSLIKDGDEE